MSVQLLDLVDVLLLLHLEEALHASELALDDTRLILDLKLALSHGFIESLAKLYSVLLRLLCFGRIILVILLQHLIVLLDLVVVVLFLQLQLTVAVLFSDSFLDRILKVLIGEVLLHFDNQLPLIVDHVKTMTLDKQLIAGRIGVVVELATELKRGIFQLL